eukprot:GGOE01020145.1.p1 GENE.GGOE01020145.1~~GGOE01020145.1.p1  ORF type:complete len:623 (+),score=117.17 GGOE01020145.1:56-1870(+)
MSPQEVSVFLLARQLQQPNVLVLDTRQQEEFLVGTRIRIAIWYYEGLQDSEVGMTHYERVIGYGPQAHDIVQLFSANHHGVFSGDLEAFAKEFPDLCWSSVTDGQLSLMLEQPGTLVVDTRREGFNSGLRLRNAVNFIPNVGFTGWCRRVVSHPWYHTVICYGPDAFSASASFPGCDVHIYTGNLITFSLSYPQHCFDTRRCSSYCHKELANELVHVCDGFYIGSLITAPSHAMLVERGITHLIVFTRSMDYSKPQSPRCEPKGGCCDKSNADDAERTPNHVRKQCHSPPPSPTVVPTTPPVEVFPPNIRLLHLQDTGSAVRLLDKYHVKDFARLLPPNLSKDTVDLCWIVDLLNTLLLHGHKTAVLCELGISRSTAVAVAYLHLTKGFSPSDAINIVNKATNFCNPSDLLNTLPAFYSRNQYSSPYKDLVISNVVPGLLCGSLQSMTGSRRPDAPLDPAVLQRYGVTHVLSLGERPDLQNLPIKSLHIDVEDTERSSLVEHWPVCFTFINEARQNGGVVLVHCLAGVSRTGAIVIGYLMHHFGARLRDAFMLAWRKRPILQPNDAFLEELVGFEQQMFPNPSLPIAAVKDFEMSHRLCFKWGV